MWTLSHVSIWLVNILKITSACQSVRPLELGAALNLVEYHAGTLPIILSVPHGGEIMHPDILDRIDGCPMPDGECQFLKDPTCASNDCNVVVYKDMATVDIARVVYQKIQSSLNGQPYLVISHLHRNKLDPNREVEDAAQGDLIATEAYEEFHARIEQAKAAIGRGILFDIHGQTHNQNSTEVGYRISTTELNGQNYGAANSSIRALAERLGLPEKDLIVGAQSFGALLEAEGFRAVPSPRQPFPGEDKYYRGGYITKTHGSMYEGNVDAIQLEMPSEWRYDGTLEQRNQFANAIGASIAKFYELFYQ
eukprot:maker-scaffold340_size202118-snap-gene-0.23 protein:Tk00671 transcript:maker-scaffold340_size202118-snap-gene-0.23-mRNA-1 annotation:"PREDICTED: uncharacterized protein LOC100492536"